MKNTLDPVVKFKKPSSKYLSDKTQGGIKKNERYKWTVSDSPGELVYINKHDMFIDHSYQREIVENKVSAISRDWSWVSAGVIIVAERNKKLWIIDGQHRWRAACRRSDIEVLPCIVFEATSVEKEAKSFLDVNAKRKPIGSIGKFKALLASGDRDASFLFDICGELGITIKPRAHRQDEIQCVGLALKKIHIDGERFRKILALTQAISTDMPIKERILDGLWHLDLNVDGGIYAGNRLYKRVVAVGGPALIDGAFKASAFYSKGGASIWAAGMLSALNKGLQKKFDMAGAVG